MGTRAIITIDRQPLVATHWDGYPDGGGLGSKILAVNPQTPQEIINIAKKFTIDFVRKDFHKKVNKERIEEIMKKHGITREEVGEGIRRSAVISANDYEIGKIESYGDFPNFQYNLDTKTKTWKVAEYGQSWDESAPESEFMSIQDMVEKLKGEE
ncbi:MAG: helix-turn-helix transcriptional regulator [Cellulophaga sp.]